MLQDDRYFLRPLFREPARDFDAGRVGAEGDREMMFSGQLAQRGDFPKTLRTTPRMASCTSRSYRMS